MNLLPFTPGFGNPTELTYVSQNRSAFDDLKSFLCPKCNCKYDVRNHQNVYKGKVPLILHCNHTVCQDCIRASLNNGQIICKDCEHLSIIDKNDKRNLWEIFPINFYVMGLFHYVKGPNSTKYQLNLRPAGMTYRNVAKRYRSFSSPTNQTTAETVTISSVIQAKCSQDSCNKPATLRCVDCEEIYCQVCCQTIHKAARGLQSHKISSLFQQNAVTEVREKCTIHPSSLLEFNCTTCNQIMCCYCVLEGHRDHDSYQITNLEKEKQSKFEELIEKAEIKVKKLFLALKNVQQELQNGTSIETSSVENAISKYFLNMHARIQRYEEKVKKDAFKAKNINTLTLTNMSSELSKNICVLSGLITSAKSLNNPNSASKINVGVLSEKLENALDLPSYLIGKSQTSDQIGFITDDNILHDLDEKCFIKLGDNSDSFRLVRENELPPDYDTLLPAELQIADLKTLTSPPQTPSSTTSSIVNEPICGTKPKIFPMLSFKSPNNATEATQNVPSLKIGDRERVEICHIENPECFYVHLLQLRSIHEDLRNHIAQHISSFATSVAECEKNKLYLVKYEIGGSAEWCRARVIDILKDDDGTEKYKVLFIDYGNTQVVNIKMLREMTSTLSRIKPLAFRCKLAETFPLNDVWNPEAIKLMVQMLNGTSTIIIVTNIMHGILEVDLRTVIGGTSYPVNKALIFAGYASPYLETAFSVPEEINLKASPPKVKLHEKTVNFKTGQYINVEISHVVDPYNVYVQEAANYEHIRNQNVQITKYYSGKTRRGSNCNDFIYVPKIGMLVAVLSNEGKPKWYRGIVKDLSEGKGSVTVFLVDYGKNITTSYMNIRKLSEQFRHLECQAMLVKLADIKPPNDQQEWPENSKQYLRKCIQSGYKLRLLINNTETPPEVVLFEYSVTVDRCINALMVKESLAEATGEMALKVDWVKEVGETPAKPETARTTRKTDDGQCLFHLLDTLQSSKNANLGEENDSDEDDSKDIIKKPVRVLRCDSPDSIYVALENPTVKQTQFRLHNELNHYYSTHIVAKQNWNVNDICVVLKHKPDTYYRAIILELIDKLNYRVLLRDIAEITVVSKSNIMMLEPQFKQVTDGAIRCHMSGIIPAGDKNKWSGLSIDWLTKIFKEYKNIFITKSGPIDKTRKSLPIIIWYTELKAGTALEPSKTILRNINKLIIKNGLALKDRSSTQPIDLSSTSDAEELEKPVNEDVETTIETCEVKTSAGPNSNQEAQPNKMFKHRPKQRKSLDNEKSQSDNDNANDIIENENPRCRSLGSSPLHCDYTLPGEKVVQKAKIDWNLLVEQDDNLDNKQHQCRKNELADKECSNSAAVGSIIPPCTTGADWLPAKPFNKKQFFAYGTFVDDDARIVLHDAELEPVLKKMEEEMKSVFDNIPPEPLGTIWIPGQMCTVKYFLDNSWYRGKVLSVNENSVKVCMIDYGNEEDCNHDDLRVKVMYLDLPIFANKIKLRKVFPKSSRWLTSDMDELHKLVVEQRLFVILQDHVKPGLVPAADVYVGDLSVNDYMVQACSNLVDYKSKAQSAPALNEADVIIEGEYSDDSLSIFSMPLPRRTFEFTKKSIPRNLIGKRVDLGVISILNYNKFIFEYVEESMNETKALFEAISEDIMKYAEKQPIIYDLKIGQACVAKYSVDGNWYRAEIFNLDKIEDELVEVWFVDFGNFEQVPREMIKRISPDWLQLPVYQLRGQIASIELVNKSDFQQAFEYMAQLCGMVRPAEIVSNDPLLVRLYDDQQLAYQALIDMGILTIND